MNLFSRHTSDPNHHPFDFGYLWNIALDLNHTNPRNLSIYHPEDNQSRLTLTYNACVSNVGTGYTPYSRQDVYDRVILWRLPLLALVATATLPALGYKSQLFTILHLIADPIDALCSLFYKLNFAERQAEWARSIRPSFMFTEGAPAGAEVGAQDQGSIDAKHIRQQSLLANNDKYIKRYFGDCFASISNAYEEWHLGSEAINAIKDGL
jgi:hypothetical protein